jgi:hypothetical protein
MNIQLPDKFSLALSGVEGLLRKSVKYPYKTGFVCYPSHSESLASLGINFAEECAMMLFGKPKIQKVIIITSR